LHYININGKLTEADSQPIYATRGFRYGYGLFETILFKEGNIALKQYHWERLFSGLRQLYFDIPAVITPEWLEDEILKTVQKNNLVKLCRVRLQIYAGEGGILGAKTNYPAFIIECFKLEKSATELNNNGLVIGIARGLQKSVDSLSNLKTSNALIYVMAGQQAASQKWNDALICNSYNNIIESTIANIFWVKNETIFTPPLSEGCIAGVMRRHIITSLAKQDIRFEEKPLSKQELLEADGIFTSNAIRRIKWVGLLENKNFKPDQIKQLYSRVFRY
jgi:branched-chain amino acid aminotransferase